MAWFVISVFDNKTLALSEKVMSVISTMVSVTGGLRYHGGLIKGPLKPLEHHGNTVYRDVQGGASIMPKA